MLKEHHATEAPEFCRVALSATGEKFFYYGNAGAGKAPYDLAHLMFDGKEEASGHFGFDIPVDVTPEERDEIAARTEPLLDGISLTINHRSEIDLTDQERNDIIKAQKLIIGEIEEIFGYGMVQRGCYQDWSSNYVPNSDYPTLAIEDDWEGANPAPRPA